MAKLPKEIVNNFELQPEILLVNNRPCRVFIPPFLLDESKYYWVRYLDDESVEIINESNLKILKNGHILYGKT
jgi:hypothetical protein